MEDTKPPKPNLEVQGELDELETQISSPARTKSLISSPEFEFCMLRNSSFPQPQILFADELIADGVLVPLDLVSQLPDSNLKEKEEKDEKKELELAPAPAAKCIPESSTSTSSKRWTDIFKINTNDKKTCTSIAEGEAAEDKVKKKNRKSSVGGGSGSGSGVISAAELNINIWPFSRSWSGGNNRSKSGGSVGSRKVSSAPCSRSNSAGESKSRNRPNSPRPGGGIYLGRNSPVWQQVRRKDAATECRKNKTKNTTTTTTISTTTAGGGSDVGGGGKSKGLNLSVPMCMGYRQQLSCRREDNILVDAGGGGVGGAGEGTKFFHLRTLFTKKVH